jgi:hypothetical protein
MGSFVFDICSILKKTSLYLPLLLVSFILVINLQWSLLVTVEPNRIPVQFTDFSYRAKKLLVGEHSVISFIGIGQLNLG